MPARMRCLAALAVLPACSNASDVQLPASIGIVTGNSQSALAGTVLPTQLSVVVVGEDAAGWSDAPVVFVVTSGGGSVSEDTVRTDAAGVARTTWTLGTAEGVQTVSASTAGEGGVLAVTFTATALVPTTLRAVGGQFQGSAPGTALPDPVVFEVLAGSGAPIPGIYVRFSAAAGLVTPESALTDNLGRAQVAWTLGGASGDQTLQASVARPAASPLASAIPAWAGTMTNVALGDSPYGLALNAAGRLYVTQVAGTTVAGGSLATKTFAAGIPVGGTPTGVTFNPAGTRAWVTNQTTGTVSVIDAAADTVMADVDVPNNPFVIAFTPNGAEAFVATNIGMVYRVDAATFAITDSVMTANGANGLAVNPAGTRLYVSSFAGGGIREVDLATFDVVRTFSGAPGPQGVLVSADGSELYAAATETLEFWNLASGTRVATVPLPGGGFGIAASPDGSTLAVSILFAGRIVRVNRTSRSRLGTIMVGGDPRRLSYSADGQSLVVANNAGWVTFVP